MATISAATPLTNGVHTESKSFELAVELPHSPGLRVNLRLTVLANSVLLFLTSSSPDSSQGSAAMGSFIYGLPDVCIISVFADERNILLIPRAEIQPHPANKYCNLHHSIDCRLRDTPGKGAYSSLGETVLCQQQSQLVRGSRRRKCGRGDGSFPRSNRCGHCSDTSMNRHENELLFIGACLACRCH